MTNSLHPAARKRPARLRPDRAGDRTDSREKTPLSSAIELILGNPPFPRPRRSVAEALRADISLDSSTALCYDNPR